MGKPDGLSFDLPVLVLPRDAMHKRGLCRHAVSVCVSVCVSVTFVHCVKTNKDVFNFLSPSGSHTILVFPHQIGWQYSDGKPLTGASNAGGIGRNRDSEPISRCACCWRCNMPGVVNVVTGGRRPPTRKL